MKKEIIICAIILVLIFFGDYITQKYTRETIDTMSSSLEDLMEEVKQENVNQDTSKDKVKKVYDEWDARHTKLSYYIEHDELEKVETNFSGIDDYIDSKNYDEAIVEIDKTIYSLHHIHNKINFNLENIF